MPESDSPNAPWWSPFSTLTLSAVGTLSKAFLALSCNTKVYGLDNFTKLLDARSDPSARERGLITVSNHLSVFAIPLDDPLIWGVLPFRHFNPLSTRWSLGSADVCFNNGPYHPISQLFTFGQTLPTHRLMHSPYGGLYQPTMTQCIRLLSSTPFSTPIRPPTVVNFDPPETDDPFSVPLPLTHYFPTPNQAYPSPSHYLQHRLAWVHIFPEGRIHQHPDHRMRYFKWGLARLILESDPCPEVVPIFISGFSSVMHEERTFPRFLPRIGKDVSITFGERMNRDLLEGWRKSWEMLKSKAKLKKDGEAWLKNGDEANALRIKVVAHVREEIVRLRKEKGWPDDDPKGGLVETWREEGDEMNKTGRKKDGSVLGNA